MEKQFNLKVRQFKQELIAEYLHKCTPEQQELFNKMYISLEEMPELR